MTAIPEQNSRQIVYVGGLFRIALYAVLLLHFLPLVWHWPQVLNSGAAFQWIEIAPTTFGIDLRHHMGLVTMAPVIFVVGTLMGMLGLHPRIAAALTYVGIYLFLACNSLGLKIAATDAAFGYLTLVLIFGHGDAALTLQKRQLRVAADRTDWLPNLLLMIYLLVALWSAGLEKLLAGWLTESPMYFLLNLPPDTLGRVALGCEFCRGETAAHLLSLLSVGFELGVPLLFLRQAWRPLALLAVALFFLILATLFALPATFFVVFVGGMSVFVVEERQTADAGA